jgi:hypothetical protein
LALAGCASDVIQSQQLNGVKSPAEPLCGVQSKLRAVNYLSAEDSYSTLDLDVCRALAGGAWGNSNRLLSEHKREFAVASGGLDVAEAFELTLPMGLVLEGKAVTTSLSGLPTHLPTSSATSPELFERFLLLRAERGFEAE